MRIIFTLFLIFTSFCAHCEISRQWIPIQDEKQLITAYLDINSIVYFQKEIIQAQYLVNYGLQPASHPRLGRSSIDTIEIDCSKKTKYRTLNTQWFEQNFAKGKSTEDKKIDPSWHLPPFDTHSKVIIKSLCQ